MDIHMITLVPYDKAWPKLFEDEKSKLKQILSDVIVGIEHIGSTAIPEIYAKPVIDILIGVKDLKYFNQEHKNIIKSLGYEYVQEFEQQLPNRRFFIKNDKDGNRTHHIHLVNYDSAWYQKHILFRDYLRLHPEDAKAYELHKLHLAKQFDDTGQYAVAKTEYCRAIDKKAYLDFSVNKPKVTTNRLKGFIPQLACYEKYKEMFQDESFVNCFGVKLTDEQLKKIIERDMNYWDQFSFGPFVWFDKDTHNFVGEGGLNHTKVEDKEVIELTYSLTPNYWGKGLAVEIGRFAIDYAFNYLKLDNIVCFTMTKNSQSLRVMEKLGFKYENNFIHFNLSHKLYRLNNLNK